MFSHQLKTRLFNIAASPFFLALPLTLMVILFLPGTATKYEVKQVKQEYPGKPNALVYFRDLNRDGIDEEIQFFSNLAKGEAAFKVIQPDGCTYEQWNFPGYYQKYGGRFFCTDLNDDGYPEIYIFYYNNDSAFMGALQPYPDKKVLFLKKFITRINKREGKIDFEVNNLQKADMNGDGNKDLLFGISAGFSLQPRKIFIYNPVTGQFRSSQSLGAKPGQLILADLNGDSVPEIYCATTASGNIHDSLRFPYNDYSSWFMGFNTRLHFLFKPIRLNRYPLNGEIRLFKNSKGKKFIASAAYLYKAKKFELAFFTYGGKTVATKTIDFPYAALKNNTGYFRSVFYHNKPYILLENRNGNLILYDENFHLRKIKTHLSDLRLVFAGDIDGDGHTEYIFQSGFGFHYTITNANFKTMARFNTNFKPEPFYHSWGIVHLPGHKQLLYKQNGETLSYFSYEPDDYFYLKYPLWALIYAFIVAVLWFSHHLQKIQAERKQQMEETINTLQMKTIRSQMDPHFMFNVLNGVAGKVSGGKREEAYNYILRFSKLLRAMMNKTERIDITLENEINFVRNYLELEKFRFKEDFDYDIQIDKAVDLNLKIPRMLVQLLVENAIKHGLRNRKGQKKLLIHLKRQAGKTIITVEDNGIGRKAAAKIPSGSGKGLRLINDMIRLNRKLGGPPITLTYIDLYDPFGRPAGTRAEVVVEENQKT
jgi:hypothetical protein